MATTITKHERNLSAIIHASMFSKYFIPFGNFILPLILWTANKKEHAFVDYNGKQALNFQISMLLYSIVAGLVTIPFFIGFWPDLFDWNFFGFHGLSDLNNLNIHIDSDDFRLGRLIWPVGISGFLQVALAVVNIVFTILATIRTNEGEYFKYPFTIKFIK
ncbi:MULTISPECIES: DUF4870 domain-containing protein [Flavobacteriaceae]|jgi:uncharacterized Tic20 family protein|uniref:DUF4870 domain-containing protein n=2 Tax=Flavobacteriaceae TaxID=49546 RepID=A0ABS3ET75_9FLAO|nr:MULTISPECIES: DUF4870 domain-containing protein [Allomuricauda]MBO0329436.1 DUF4870 domain-containing protein [[Muricauda] lutisoli]MBO0341417.1 DUF4870 domain-containing protein [Allomuricauda profundi]MEC7771302.1 DUF4870 domain-containing protein [Bacteroidota bacterium]